VTIIAEQSYVTVIENEADTVLPNEGMAMIIAL
jgi:hypothetical protein